VAAVRKLFQQVALNESAGDSANDKDFTKDLEVLDVGTNMDRPYPVRQPDLPAFSQMWILSGSIGCTDQSTVAHDHRA
jgi:hypothetical protein